MTGWAVIHGDALDVLRGVESDSCDGMLCDPPGGLEFMGHKWDSDKGGKAAWVAWLSAILREAYRALKPGAYALVWAYPTTSHWTMDALEQAGFEICHKLFHFVGNRTPKNHNIQVAMDKADGLKGPVIGTQVLTGTAALSTEDKGGTYSAGVSSEGAPPRTIEIRAPATDESARWAGHGTAIRTLCEEWLLVQKPIRAKTIVRNVRAWGTGAINIDGCRNGTEGGTRKVGQHPETERSAVYGEGLNNGGGPEPIDDGRWPCDVILAPAVAEEMDAIVGDRPSTLTGRADPTRRHDNPGDNRGTSTFGAGNSAVYADDGGPSRFFHVYERMQSHPGWVYTTKVATKEREAGCDDIPLVTAEIATGRKRGSTGILDGRAGTGRTSSRHNDHPTLKPLALTEHLARLLMPAPRTDGQGLRLLVPFAGAGSEMIGGILAGWDFILGAELGARNALIACARCAHWQARLLKLPFESAANDTRASSEARLRATVPAPAELDARQLGLFGAA